MPVFSAMNSDETGIIAGLAGIPNKTRDSGGLFGGVGGAGC
jgi:hypothetical protein